MNKETFMKKGTNAGVITAGSIISLNYNTEASKNDNLPHNQLSLTNRSTEELYLFLDDMTNAEVPDYILKAGQQMSLSHEEGITFNTLFIKNVDGVNQVEINELKHRISTVKEL